MPYGWPNTCGGPAITASVARGIRVITTNSDSDLDRRAFLLNELGPGSR